MDKINLVPLSKRKAEAISEIEFDYFFVETRLYKSCLECPLIALNIFAPTIDADNMENTPFPGLSQLVILDKELEPVHQIDLDYYVEDLASDAGSDYIAIKHHYGIDSIRHYAFDEDRWGIFGTLLDVKRSTPCFEVKSGHSIGVNYINEADMLYIDQYRLDKDDVYPNHRQLMTEI